MSEPSKFCDDAIETRVSTAIARAAQAQVSWANRSLDERIEQVRALAQVLLGSAEEAVVILSEETGRSKTESRLSEIATVKEYVEDAIRTARVALSVEKVRLSALDFPKKKGKIEMIPRGVIGVIAPWNYPLMQFYKSLFPALLAGNAVVLKPSELAPRAGEWLAEKCREVLPEGLVELLSGGGDVGVALVKGGLDGVVFTGSVATGRSVAEACARQLIPCSVELGGKDAAIVLEDCDFDRTVAGVLWAGMHNCGHDCAAVERVYVVNSIADRFVTALGDAAKRLDVFPQGRCDIGTVQNARQLKTIEEHVSDALEKGARVIAGGSRINDGLGYYPTVLDGCTHEMRVVTEETFGPVIAVIRVQDGDEGVRAANDSQYGLNGSVWTQDISKGQSLAGRLQVGVAHVNNHKWTGGTLAHTPWTGIKDTGFGVAGSRHAYHLFARPRLLMWDGNTKPEPFWLPMNEDLEQFSKALIQRGRGQFSALFKLLPLLGKRVKAVTEFVRGE